MPEDITKKVSVYAKKVILKVRKYVKQIVIILVKLVLVTKSMNAYPVNLIE